MADEKQKTQPVADAQNEGVRRQGYTDRNLNDPYDPENPEEGSEKLREALDAPPGHAEARQVSTLPNDKKNVTEKPAAANPTLEKK